MSLNVFTPTSRPRPVLLAIALIASLLTLAYVASGASAASGGIGTGTDADPDKGGSTKSEPSDLNVNPPKFDRLWNQVSPFNRRWARSTSECESGHDPDAIGYGGEYRGAFQFTEETWDASPKSPGGDPTGYSYRTQAVVAVALKLRDGAGHWPVCG